MGDGEPAVRPCEVVVVSRSPPFPVRYVRWRSWRASRPATPTSLYATATYAAAAAAAGVARRPLVVKLVSDPAYERAQRYGLFGGSLEEFQRPAPAVRGAQGGADPRAPPRTGDRRPERIPRADRGRLGPRRGRMHGAPQPAPRRSRSTASRWSPGTFVFVGRLTRQKDLDIAIDAIAQVPEARLSIVGDGPERAHLDRAAATRARERGSRFRGALPRAEALRTCSRPPTPA